MDQTTLRAIRQLLEFSLTGHVMKQKTTGLGWKLQIASFFVVMMSPE